MKKYLWLILVFAFVGMRAESGWEDFGTYQKQKLIMPEIKRLQIDFDNNIFYTYQNSGIIRKMDLETGVQIDSLLIDTLFTEFFFSNDNLTGVCLSTIIDTLQPVLIKIINLKNWQTIKILDSIVISKIFTLPNKREMKELSFSFADFISQTQNIFLGIKANTSYRDYYSRTGENFGKLNAYNCSSDTLILLKEFLKEQLKNLYFYNDHYYLTEYLSYSFTAGSYSGYGNYNASFQINTSNLVNKSISNYRFEYYGKHDLDSRSGYYRSIDAVIPTNDTNIVIQKLSDVIQIFDISTSKPIDSLIIKNSQSIELLKEGNYLLSLDKSTFDIYDLEIKQKFYSVTCPINIDNFKLLENHSSLLCWNNSGEMVYLNIYPTKSFGVIKSDKYYANPNDEIKFSYFAASKPFKLEWDFGDGNVSNDKYPTHKYKTKGKYKVKITITDSIGHNYIYFDDKPILIKEKLIADFEVKDYAPSSPSIVYFTNKSTGEPTNYKWTTSQFDTSHNQNPIFTFKSPGYYTVKLVIWDEFQVDTLIKTNCIILDFIKQDTFKLVKEYSIPNIFTTQDDKDYIISEIINSKIMLFQNHKFLLHFSYKADKKYSPTNYYFNIFGLSDSVNLSQSLVIKDTKINYNLLTNSESKFLISQNNSIKLYDLNLKEINSFDYIKFIKVGFSLNNLFFLATTNYILIYDDTFKLYNNFKVDIEPLLIKGFSVNNLEIIGKNKDSISYQEIKNSTLNNLVNLLKPTNFHMNLNYKFLSSDKIAIFGTIIKSNVELGYLSIYNKTGELILEKEFKDVIQITEIDTINEKSYYVSYKSRFKAENGIITLDNEFLRINKICFFDLDSGFKQIMVKHYKDNSFFLLGYSNDTSGIKPILLLLDINSKVPNNSDPNLDNTITNFKLFPNPTSDYINLNNADICNLKIYDLNGIELDCESAYFENMVRINTSQLQTGIYFVRYEINGKIYNEKFLKI